MEVANSTALVTAPKTTVLYANSRSVLGIFWKGKVDPEVVEKVSELKTFMNRVMDDSVSRYTKDVTNPLHFTANVLTLGLWGLGRSVGMRENAATDFNMATLAVDYVQALNEGDKNSDVGRTFTMIAGTSQDIALKRYKQAQGVMKLRGLTASFAIATLVLVYLNLRCNQQEYINSHYYSCKLYSNSLELVAGLTVGFIALSVLQLGILSTHRPTDYEIGLLRDLSSNLGLDKSSRSSSI